MTKTSQLREEYRETWQRLAREVDFLQSLTNQPVRDYTQIEAALEAVQAARAAHNEIRDQWAAALGRAGVVVNVRYASSSINSIPEPANTEPSLTTRA